MLESAVPREPFEFFSVWFAAAAAAGLPEPNAMILATASPGGAPDARTVLLKGHGTDGFRFFTNHTSRKGQDLLVNPRAALVFPWHEMERQVRVTGAVRRLPEEDSAAYFHSRPYGSQIGAWASAQSTVVGSRAELEGAYAETAARWPDPAVVEGAGEVPLPDFWGGYLVVPAQIEFWQGRRDRLHDRLRYRRVPEGGTEGAEWVVERLSP